MAKSLIDTNCLLDYPEILDSLNDEIIIHSILCEEIDNIIHNSADEQKKYKARQARNAIKNAQNKIYSTHIPSFSLPLGWEYDKNDNSLLRICKDLDCVLITNDLAMQIKADSIGVQWKNYKISDNEKYKGYEEIILDEFELAAFYECQVNKWGLLENEYLILKDGNGDIVDKLKWTKKGFKHLDYKGVDSKYVGKVKPRNIEQELYMDLLQDKESKIKVCTGFYGTGKDYLALANFLSLVEKGKFDKILWVRNNIEVQGTKPVGFLPGTLTEKLSVFADIICDFVGDKLGFEMLINQGKLELVHTGFLRGRDLRNSIIYCTEAQNMTKELIQLIISRVSDGSIIFFNGDIKQTDSNLFRENNGLNCMINTFKGNKNFAYVQLNKCERSEIAEMASLLE
jgi:PhoH-like ATPase